MYIARIRVKIEGICSVRHLSNLCLFNCDIVSSPSLGSGLQILAVTKQSGSLLNIGHVFVKAELRRSLAKNWSQHRDKDWKHGLTFLSLPVTQKWCPSSAKKPAKQTQHKLRTDVNLEKQSNLAAAHAKHYAKTAAIGLPKIGHFVSNSAHIFVSVGQTKCDNHGKAGIPQIDSLPLIST